MPPIIRLDLYRGEAKTITFTLLDSKTRARIDLTAKTLYFNVREDIDSASLAIEKSTGSGIVNQDQVSETTRGNADLTIDAADTGTPADLTLTEYVWDLWLDDELVVAPSALDLLASVRGL